MTVTVGTTWSQFSKQKPNGTFSKKGNPRKILILQHFGFPGFGRVVELYLVASMEILSLILKRRFFSRVGAVFILILATTPQMTKEQSERSVRLSTQEEEEEEDVKEQELEDEAGSKQACKQASQGRERRKSFYQIKLFLRRKRDKRELKESGWPRMSFRTYKRI
jgi:hypothetical protein